VKAAKAVGAAAKASAKAAKVAAKSAIKDDAEVPATDKAKASKTISVMDSSVACAGLRPRSLRIAMQAAAPSKYVFDDEDGISTTPAAGTKRKRGASAVSTCHI